MTPLLAGGEPAQTQDDLAGIDVRGGGVVAVGGEGRVLVRE